MQKKIPMRQCASCREMKPKRELTRVVKSPQGSISVDHSGKAPGRGVYLCSAPDCLKKAIKTKALGRALNAAIPDEIYERLSEKREAPGG